MILAFNFEVGDRKNSANHVLLAMYVLLCRTHIFRERENDRIFRKCFTSEAFSFRFSGLAFDVLRLTYIFE